MATAADGTGACQELRRVKFVADLLVTCEDGKERTVAVPPVSQRRRWQSVAAVLNDMNWLRVEARNASGATLRIIENATAQAGDLEDVAPNAASKRTAEVQGLLSLMLSAQERVMKHHTDVTGRVLDAQVRMIEAQAKQIERMMASRKDDIETISELVEELGEMRGDVAEAKAKGSDDGGNILGLVKDLAAVNRMPDTE